MQLLQPLQPGEGKGDVDPGGLHGLALRLAAEAHRLEQAVEGQHLVHGRNEVDLRRQPDGESRGVGDPQEQERLLVLEKAGEDVALDLRDVQQRFLVLGLGPLNLFLQKRADGRGLKDRVRANAHGSPSFLKWRGPPAGTRPRGRSARAMSECCEKPGSRLRAGETQERADGGKPLLIWQQPAAIQWGV